MSPLFYIGSPGQLRRMYNIPHPHNKVYPVPTQYRCQLWSERLAQWHQANEYSVWHKSAVWRRFKCFSLWIREIKKIHRWWNGYCTSCFSVTLLSYTIKSLWRNPTAHLDMTSSLIAMIFNVVTTFKKRRKSMILLRQ